MKTIFKLLIVFSIYGFTVGTEDRTYEGIAKDRKSNEFIYKEVHKEIFMSGEHVQTITSFLCNNNEEFARRELDFSTSFEKPFYLLKDSRSGLLEKVVHKGDNFFEISYQKNHDSKQKTKTLYVPEPAIVDGGFNYFIKNNWHKLEKNEKLTFNFLSVAFQDFFPFRIYKVDQKQDEENIMLLKMECDKLLLRVLMAPIMIHYDTSSKRIFKYEGISNIRDESGSSYRALLQYPNLGP